MTSFGSRDSEITSKPTSYCRKDKSLYLLCSNFLRMYDLDGMDTIGLDDAASRLGVERRRIYDVVNILESIGVVARKGKNQYRWKGLGEIPNGLKRLKEAGSRENFSLSACLDLAKEQQSQRDTDSEGDEKDNSAPLKTENKREKSLALLTENFVKLFLCSEEDLISLDCAAVALLGGVNNSKAMRTKVRRLYDIANVLNSMNLIEKMPHPVSRKPSFKWLGWKGNVKNEPETRLDLNEPKKRNFGTDLTNYSSKRSRVDSSDKPTHMLLKCQKSGNNCDRDEQEQRSNCSSKGFVFGPFAPVGVNKVGGAQTRSERWVQERESLASPCRPNHHNQEALYDLFAQYVEVWKSWYVEVSGRI